MCFIKRSLEVVMLFDQRVMGQNKTKIRYNLIMHGCLPTLRNHNMENHFIAPVYIMSLEIHKKVLCHDANTWMWQSKVFHRYATPFV